MNSGPTWPRRTALAVAVSSMLAGARRVNSQERSPERQWYEAAVAMRELAVSWGDQPYGAVLVSGGHIIGHGPSRVIRSRNPDAHAEREALRDALDKHGKDAARGAVLVSTSRPCWACEQAAARAGVARMVFGAALEDAGAPRAGL